MNAILGHPALYLAVPFYVAAISVFAIFHVPSEFTVWLVVFPAITTIGVVIDLLLYFRFENPATLIRSAVSRLGSAKNNAANQLSVVFGLVVLAACFADLGVNGLKISNASQYADLTPMGTRVRHISNMCWVLVPIALFAIKSRTAKSIFIAAAVIFPILFVDRNRLIQAIFCLLWGQFALSKQSKLFSIKSMIGLLIVLSVFVAIGFTRSGVETFVVPSSGHRLVENQYPLVEWFPNIPVSLQQIILYISTPLFNFATISASGYRDESFLLSQLFSFLGNAASDIVPPILVPRYNVGTEFFPFLLFDGVYTAIAAFVGMYFLLLAVHFLFIQRPNIFYLLIYQRVAYCCLMSAFAPQFYTWTNIDFLILCFLAYQIHWLLVRQKTIVEANKNAISAN